MSSRNCELLAGSGKAGRDGREDLAPKKVARVADIGIALILDPRQLMGCRVVEQGSPSEP
jgi:hypothetical protein